MRFERRNAIESVSEFVLVNVKSRTIFTVVIDQGRKLEFAVFSFLDLPTVKSAVEIFLQIEVAGDARARLFSTRSRVSACQIAHRNLAVPSFEPVC